MIRAIYYLFVIIGFINFFHFCFYLIGANFYDIRHLKAKKTRSRIKKRTKRPLVTMLIPAHNEELVIERCLDSVSKSTYRKLQIIVIDDASSDSTRKIVRDFIKNHPKKDIFLMFKRKNGGKAAALNHALKKLARGELVMTLDSDSIIAPSAVSNAVSYFSDPKVVGVAANVRIIEEITILGFLQRFEHMVGYRSKKTHSLLNCEFIIGGVASTYRTEVLRQVGFYDTTTLTEDIGLSMKVIANGNRDWRLVYAADVVAMTEGVDNFKALLKQRYRWKYGNLQNVLRHKALFANMDQQFTKSLTFYRMPMAFLGELILLLEPITIGYVIYLTILMHDFSFVVGSYLIITIYLLMVLWADEHLDFRNRLRLSLYVPIAYFIFYIMNVVQLVAVLRCLKNFRKLADDKQSVGHWISPKRVGRQRVYIG